MLSERGHWSKWFIARRWRRRIGYWAGRRGDSDAAQMRMAGEQREVTHAGEGDVRCLQLRHQNLGIERAKGGLHPRIGFAAPLHPLDIGGESGVGGKQFIV